MQGHGYEADIWAIGCMMYAMLCGTPPFETQSINATYLKISKVGCILVVFLLAILRTRVFQIHILEMSFHSHPHLNLVNANGTFCGQNTNSFSILE